METFAQNVLMKRPGQPEEVAPSHIFLVSADGSSFARQTLHPNAATSLGDIIGG